MKKEHFEHVYQKFECCLKHDCTNHRFEPEFEHELISTISIKRHRSDPSLFMVTGTQWVLFGRLQSFAIAEEILDYIHKTEIMFT